MSWFFELSWWNQLLLIFLGVPVSLTLIYILSRLVFKALFMSYFEQKQDMINKLFSLGDKPQNNPKKEGGQKDVNR